MAERVCMEWKELMRAPSLWNNIDLTQFKIQCVCEGTDSACLNCYEAYKDRIEKFLNYLLAIEPNIKSFRFAFDISDFEDDWMRILMRFLTSVQITDLQFAYLNWKETPEKRIQTQEVAGSLVDNSNDTMSKHRRRQRHFERFFHFFTQSASRVSHLVMPFDWSLTSIQYIGRLGFLKTLVLRSYSVPQPKFEQCLLDELMKAAPYLKRLTMSICIGSGQGMLPFVMVSKSLEYLDLSECEGFGLVKVNLPRLKEFRGSQKPYKCSFIGNDDNDPADSTPCILQVLRLGAPKLASLNGCRLSDDWMKADYDIELGDVLNQTCTCFLHRRE